MEEHFSFHKDVPEIESNDTVASAVIVFICLFLCTAVYLTFILKEVIK